MQVIIDLLHDDKGNFEWASIAAIVALIAALISLFNVYLTNKLNFKGNVVAKSRIEWIQDVRKLSVEFITSCYSLLKYVEILESKGFFDEDSHEKRITKISRDSKLLDLKKDLQEKGTLLTLYFGPDSSENNEFVNYIVTHILDKVEKMGIYYPVGDILHLDKFLFVLKDFLRIYFKAEWKRANGEIKESELQNYLELNNTYNRIMTIFKSGINSNKEWIEAYYNDLDSGFNQD